MKRNTTSFLLMLLMMLSLCFLCTACGKDAKSADSAESVNHTENVDRAESNTISPENDLNEGLGGDFPIYNEDNGNEVSWYGGLWLSEVTDQYDYLSIDAVGNWQLYSDGNVIDEGYLWYDSEWDITYITSYQVGAADGGQVEMEGDQLYITTLGYFSNCASEDDIGDGYYSWDSELCQRDVSEFAGVWYFDGDLSATTYIVIDGYGNWSYFQRVPGDAEGTEMDYGTFSYSTYEVATYYADSAMYDGLSIQVLELDEGVLLWGDEGSYYRMEDYWYSENGNGDGYYSWDSELCQRNVSEFEGVWYCDGDFSATTYIVIDGYGNWSYYQRVPGDAEGTEMDYGTFSYSTDECSIYYADSAVYNGISFRVFEFDEDTLVWDNEGTFYRMEW